MLVSARYNYIYIYFNLEIERLQDAPWLLLPHHGPSHPHISLSRTGSHLLISLAAGKTGKVSIWLCSMGARKESNNAVKSASK